MFAAVLSTMEQSCINGDTGQTTVTKNEADRKTGDSANTPSDPTSTVQNKADNNQPPSVNYSKLFPVIMLMIITMAVGNWLIHRLLGQTPLSPAAATTTPASPTILPTISSTSTSNSPAAIAEPTLRGSEAKSFCGEKDILPVKIDSSQFLRSQGVIVFNSKTTPGILSNKVRFLNIDSRGLWIGYFMTDNDSTSGLSFYDRTNQKMLDCSQLGLTEGQNINAIATDQNGTVWVGMEKGGIAAFDGTKWRLYTTNDGLPSDWIYGLTVDKDNHIWAATYEGIAQFNGSQWNTLYTLENGSLINNRTHMVIFDSSNNLWVGYIADGVSVYHPSTHQWEHFSQAPHGLGGNAVRSMAVRKESGDEQESIWVATADGGVSKYHAGIWTTFKAENGLPDNEVRAIAIDKYNRVWAATPKGVTYYNDKKWMIYDTLDTQSIAFGKNCPDKSCAINDDSVWSGTTLMGITHSHLPLTESGLEVVKVCFVSRQKETCPTLTEQNDQLITVNYPNPVLAGEKFNLKITVIPHSPYQLLESRGDMLVNTDVDESNLFGAWKWMAVKGSVDSGQEFSFVDYNGPFIAPALSDGKKEETFFSTWRVWMYTRYIGPSIRVSFTVKK
jgi:hypothetical protein